jgi:hypothetical protein
MNLCLEKPLNFDFLFYKIWKKRNFFGGGALPQGFLFLTRRESDTKTDWPTDRRS